MKALHFEENNLTVYAPQTQRFCWHGQAEVITFTTDNRSSSRWYFKNQPPLWSPACVPIGWTYRCPEQQAAVEKLYPKIVRCFYDGINRLSKICSVTSLGVRCFLNQAFIGRTNLETPDYKTVHAVNGTINHPKKPLVFIDGFIQEHNGAANQTFRQ